MKLPSKILLMLLLCLTTAVGFSQVSQQPKMFANFPETFTISETTLSQAFTASENQDVTLALNSFFAFPGKVLSNIVKYDNLQSITIKSAQYNDAIFHLSKIKNEDNSISYVGRIMNDRASDGYTIIKNENGTYNFKKIETGKVMQDCSF